MLLLLSTGMAEDSTFKFMSLYAPDRIIHPQSKKFDSESCRTFVFRDLYLFIFYFRSFAIFYLVDGDRMHSKILGITPESAFKNAVKVSDAAKTAEICDLAKTLLRSFNQNFGVLDSHGINDSGESFTMPLVHDSA